jgi:uncharacterized membrane protein YkoI
MSYSLGAVAIAALLLIGDRAQAVEPQRAHATTLAAAVATAERATGGMAVRAKLKNKYGRVLYEVKVIDETAGRKVLIDAATGKPVAAPTQAGNRYKGD